MKNMKEMKPFGLLVSVIVLLIVVSIVTTQDDVHAVGSSAVEDREYTVEEMLEYALQDELIAKAEYEVIMETFDVDRPFSSIARAEQRHYEAVLSLYDYFEIEVPQFDGSNYVVIPETIEEIFEVGVEAELKNIAMYEQFLSQDLDPYLEEVFTNLKEASESHLKAFERGVSGNNNGNMSNGRSNNGNNGSNKNKK